jgi:hypothetical protein
MPQFVPRWKSRDSLPGDFHEPERNAESIRKRKNVSCAP